MCRKNSSSGCKPTPTRRLYADDQSWEAQLDAWKIESAEQPASADRRRLVGQPAPPRPLQRSGADQRRCRPVQAAGVLACVVLGAHGAACRQTDPADRRPPRRARSGTGRDLELLPAAEGDRESPTPQWRYVNPNRSFRHRWWLEPPMSSW